MLGQCLWRLPCDCLPASGRVESFCKRASCVDSSCMVVQVLDPADEDMDDMDDSDFGGDADG